MSNPIKILHLVDTLSVGGAERLIWGLAERIDVTRYEIHVCCLGILHGNALQDDFKRLNIPVTVFGSKRFYSLSTFKQLLQYIRGHGIDIIHTHLTHADIIGRFAARMTGLPVISTLHNEPRNYDRDRLDRRYLERLTARFLSNRLIVVSYGIGKKFVQQWSIPANRMVTIYNAVPMESYLALPEKPSHRDRSDTVVTTIGRLSSQKAQHILIEAAQRVLAQRKDVRFLIVGQGRREQELKELVRSWGIEEQVTFTGMRRDVPTILADTDIFVLSSLWEGLPLTAVEAMAAARPVVLTDVGGNSELLQNGVQGLLVPPNNVDALTKALLTLLESEEQRVAMGRAARARVLGDFSMETFTSQHEMLYSEVHRLHHATSSIKSKTSMGLE